MTVGQIIDRFIKEYNNAKQIESIMKPYSFALHKTWLWADGLEKPRYYKENKE